MRLKLTKAVVIDLNKPEVVEDGLRCWVSGESGSGKSTVNMLIASQMLEQGGQVIVLDSHGEYGPLWQLSPGMVKRIGYDGDPVSEDSVEWCLDVVRSGKSLLLDLSHWTDLYPQKLDAFALAFIRGLYELRRKEPKRTFVLLEEAQNYAPQMQAAGQTENIKIFLAIVTGGRKFGLNFLLSSQRPSLVDVNALSGCNVRIFLRVTEDRDYKRIRAYLPPKISFERLSRFESGEAIIRSRWLAGVVHSRLLRPSVSPQKFLGDPAA